MTTNVYRRVFHIKKDKFTGTAFAIDHNTKQYLITARHVIEKINPNNQIEIFHNQQWKDLKVQVVGLGQGTIDLAVLACSVHLAPALTLEPTMGGLIIGQQVYFLGFPFGWDGDGEQLNRDFPVPFIKAGIVSALQLNPTRLIYVDAHGNQGFSGGPVIFTLDGRWGQGDFKVAGVVAHYPGNLLPIVDQNQEPILNKQGGLKGYVVENPGIVVAIGIRHALDLIDANPIGFRLPEE